LSNGKRETEKKNSAVKTWRDGGLRAVPFPDDEGKKVSWPGEWGLRATAWRVIQVVARGKVIQFTERGKTRKVVGKARAMGGLHHRRSSRCEGKGGGGGGGCSPFKQLENSKTKRVR